MVSVGGLGTLIGAFGLAGRREVERKGLLILAATIVQGSLLFAFAVLQWYALALLMLGLIGVLAAVAGATVATMIQLSVPGELRGRIMSLYLITVIAGPSVGSFLLGVLSVPLGVRYAVALSAFSVVVGVGAVFARNQTLRHAS